MKSFTIALAAAVVLLAASPPTYGATGSANGIHVRTSPGGVVVITFAPSAAARFNPVRGRRVTVRCTRFGPQGRLLREDEAESANLTAPRRRAPISVRLAAQRYDICELGRAGAPPIVTIGLTARGRTFVDEQQAARQLVDLLGFIATLSSDGAMWPSADRVVAETQGRIVALPTADAAPPAGSLGYFSDGAAHVALSVLSTAGRRLFVELAGDVMRTNVFEHLDAP